MSKAFDKVWHEGLRSYLKFHRKQVSKSFLNGQTSEWLPVKEGVLQGSIIGLID